MSTNNQYFDYFSVFKETFSTHLFTYRFTELKAVNLNIIQFLNGKTV